LTKPPYHCLRMDNGMRLEEVLVFALPIEEEHPDSHAHHDDSCN
jgi:hypothetical protein